MGREFRIPTESGTYVLTSDRDIDADTAMRIYSSGQTPTGFAITKAAQEAEQGVPAPPMSPWSRQGFAALTQPARNVVAKPVAAAVRGGFNLLTPPSPNPEMQAFNQRAAEQYGQTAGAFAGEMALPSEPAAAAIDALLMTPVVGQALGSLSRLAHLPTAVTKAIRAGSEVVGIPTATLPRQLMSLPATGAAVGAATSENPVMGGLQGAGLGVVPPVLGGALRFGRGVGRYAGDWATRNRNIQMSEAQSERALGGMLTDMPALAPTVQDLSQSFGVQNATGVLLALSDEKIGKQALRDAFGGMQAAIDTGLQQGGVQTLNLPQLAAAVRAQPQIPQGPAFAPPAQLANYLQPRGAINITGPGQVPPNTAFTPEEAMTQLKEVAWRVRDLYRHGATPAERHAASVLDKTVDQEFRDALIAANRPDLARQFLSMSNQFRQGVQYFNFWDAALSSSRIKATMPSETTTPMFDWDNIKSLMVTPDVGLSRTEFPGLFHALWSNAPIGATGVLRSFGGGMRMFANANAALPGGSIGVPRFQFYHPQGEPTTLTMPVLERLVPGLALGPLEKQLRGRNLALTPAPR